MRYHLLATDYDGTLTINDKVQSEIIEALIRLKAGGRKLILVTGRRLDELKSIFPEHHIFDRIVAENGALIYTPESMEINLSGEPPPGTFFQLLKKKNIPYVVGKVIVASTEPHQIEILDAIVKSGIEYQVIFNKGAVMVLPPGINKATGLREALSSLCISTHNTVAIGDAENDYAMLQTVECAVAVNNALPRLKALADLTTQKQHGLGVMELIDQLKKDDLAEIDQKLSRHFIGIGKETDDSDFKISPYGNCILIAGTSGSGKTTLNAAFIEKLMEMEYQYCLIDPEGDYHDLPDVLTIGDCHQVPLIEQVIKLLTQTTQNAVVSFLAIPINDRPAFFKKLLNALMNLREKTGHPHFIIMDEAHHLIPKENVSQLDDFHNNCNNLIAITTNPNLLNLNFLKQINIAMVMGESPEIAMAGYAETISKQIELPQNLIFEQGDVLVWKTDKNKPFLIRSDIPGQFLRRHKRKYAKGDMGDNSFYFTGPMHRLNLKANNLMIFIQMGSGVDDETWLFHLCKHDYSNWFRNSIKDEQLAINTENIESRIQNPQDSREAIFNFILERYTAPG